MTTLTECVEEVISHRAHIKSLEARVLALEQFASGIQVSAGSTRVGSTAKASSSTLSTSTSAPAPAPAAKDDDVSSQHGSESLGSGKVLTVLSRAVQHSCEEEQWFLKLFPGACLYSLPPGAVKNGRAVLSVFDPILSELVRKSRSGSASECALYRAFAAEWPTLFQSITYQVIQAEALSELIVLSAEATGYSDPDSFLATVTPDLYRLLSIATNLLDDQTKRASVLIAAAKKSVAAASLVSNQFISESTGIHPSAEAVYASVKATAESGQQDRPAKLSGKKPKWGEKQSASSLHPSSTPKSPGIAKKAKPATAAFAP